MLELPAGKSPSIATEAPALCEIQCCCPRLRKGFRCSQKHSVLWRNVFCRRMKDGERPPDSSLLGPCADAQALADERPAGILFVRLCLPENI